jgi:hypothetical protein
MDRPGMNTMLIENRLAVLSEPVAIGAYDFDFGLHFCCSHLYRFEPNTPSVLRIGASPKA